MLTPASKLYVQLEPDAEAKTALCSAQQSLTEAGIDIGRLMTERSLHLSVIHVGLVVRLLDAIRPFSPLTDNAIMEALNVCTDNLVAVVRAHDADRYELLPERYDLFGKRRSTYVIRFEQSVWLTDLHAACLRLLKEFFIQVGITGVEAFMAQDHNLRYALSLEPHVTIAKGYASSYNHVLPAPMRFRLMRVIYPDTTA